jgi:amidase
MTPEDEGLAPGIPGSEALPVGLQIVGRQPCDFEVIQLAHAFEGATGFGQRWPPAAG